MTERLEEKLIEVGFENITGAPESTMMAAKSFANENKVSAMSLKKLQFEKRKKRLRCKFCMEKWPG